jgi:hypothetical protein
MGKKDMLVASARAGGTIAKHAGNGRSIRMIAVA